MRKRILPLFFVILACTACTTPLTSALTQAKPTTPKTIHQPSTTHSIQVKKPLAEHPHSAKKVAVPTAKSKQKHKTPKQLNTEKKQNTSQMKKTVKQTRTSKKRVTTKSTTSKKSTSNSTVNRIGAFEQQVIELVNQERQKEGLSPLTASTKVSSVAEQKSQDMIENRYFSHQSPTYGSPFDLLKANNLSYISAGENIAAGQSSPSSVMESWMKSEGHRANILNPSYTHIGVGYKKGGSYGTYWTQLFIQK